MFGSKNAINAADPEANIDLNEESKVFMGVTLDVTTAEEVEKMFGKVDVFYSGHAANSYKCLNYISNEKDCLQTISFDGGEIDGPSVSGVTVSDFNNRITRHGKFYPTNIKCGEMHSKSGLCIGMDKKDVKSKFGKPTDIDKNTWIYEVGFIDVYLKPSDPGYKHACDWEHTDKPYYSLLYRFTIKFIKNKVVQFSIYRTEQE